MSPIPGSRPQGYCFPGHRCSWGRHNPGRGRVWAAGQARHTGEAAGRAAMPTPGQVVFKLPGTVLACRPAPRPVPAAPAHARPGPHALRGSQLPGNVQLKGIDAAPSTLPCPAHLRTTPTAPRPPPTHTTLPQPYLDISGGKGRRPQDTMKYRIKHKQCHFAQTAGVLTLQRFTIY